MLARTIVIRKRTATMKVMKTKFFLKSFIFRVNCAHFNVKMALVGKKLVEQMIKSKALVVISKSYCPFCHKVINNFPICITIQTLVWSNDMMTYQAKAALNNYKINPDNFEWLEIEDREDCNEIQVFRFLMMQAWEPFFQAYMKQLTGASSVPRVFIGGSCIGGGDETSAAHRSAASLVIQAQGSRLLSAPS